MRVIAGRLGGRSFEAPSGFKTHPMSDKIRGALFNILGDIEGLTLLDAFAGSGAISIEAVSRGAAQAVAIDNDRQAQKIIADNIRTLNLARQIRLIQASANAWLQTNPDRRFDLVVCDPPFKELQSSLIKRLTALLDTEGTFILSWPADQPLPELDLQQVTQRGYGDAQLVFYKQ